jgi:hypothetical protein
MVWSLGLFTASSVPGAVELRPVSPENWSNDSNQPSPCSFQKFVRNILLGRREEYSNTGLARRATKMLVSEAKAICLRCHCGKIGDLMKRREIEGSRIQLKLNIGISVV